MRVATGDTGPPVAEAAARSGLGLRVASALVLAPFVLAIAYAGTPYFEILVIVGAAILLNEWRTMTAAAAGTARAGWWGAGIVYVAVPCFALVWLRTEPSLGRETLMWLFAVVWSADTGAFLSGRAIGGPKLAPVISPNKTWAGLIGGIASAGVVGWAVAAAFAGDGGLARPALAVALSAGIGFIAEMGDLLESGLKRRLAVKDSGHLIPGHGGLFDRVDGLLAAAVATALIQWAGGGSILTWF